MTRPCALVVENDEHIMLLLETLLRRERFDVIAVRDGEEALEVIRRRRDISVITLDWFLPNFSGEDFTVAASVLYPDVHERLLIVTGAPVNRLGELPPKLATNVIRKPFDISELVARARATAAENGSVPVATAEDASALERRFQRDIETIGARRGVLLRFDSESRSFEPLLLVGYEHESAIRHFPLHIDSKVPLCDAVRLKKTIHLTASEMKSQYPDLIPSVTSQGIIAIPLLNAHGTPTGAIGLGFADPRNFDAALQREAQAIANRYRVICDHIPRLLRGSLWAMRSDASAPQH